MKFRLPEFCTFLFLFVALPLFAQNAYQRTTLRRGDGSAAPYCIPWVDSGSKAGTAWTNQTNYVQIYPETQNQTVLGWGGTIQEKHWEAMKPLSAAGKDSIMRELFDTTGCNINHLRLSIGCSDFDLNEAPISLNETANDYAMNNFSLKRDSTRKIPLIKMAQAINPNIKFWGCPWSPPRWMHTNGDFMTGNMKSDAQTLTAYALYLEKYVLGYKKADIIVDAVCCQNEPTIVDGGYPKCGWSNALERTFYKDYLIPRFKQSNLAARIFLGVFCCGNYDDWIPFFMNDPVIKDFTVATSHSYQSPDWGLKSFNAYPEIPFYQSEAPFGPWPEAGPQNWDRGKDIFNNVADFMNNRTSVYTMWNMVNDETGKSGFNWAQTIMLQVHSTTKQVTYNPHFYAYKHYGNYVKAGAKNVRYSTTNALPGSASAYRNPNGDIIFVAANWTNNAFPLTVRIGNTMWKATMPANSFNTYKYLIGTAVSAEKLKAKQSIAQVLGNLRISNSTLHFSCPGAANVKEMYLTLNDLQGRTVWSGHRTQSSLSAGYQAIPLGRTQGGLLKGTYLLNAQIIGSDGVARTVENKVTAVN